MYRMKKISASIITLISVFLIWYYGHMVYDEIFGSSFITYCFRPPLYVSVLNSILAIIGAFIGIKFFINQLKIRKGLIITFLLLISIFLIDNFSLL